MPFHRGFLYICNSKKIIIMKKWIILWTAALCCAFEMNAKVELPRMFQNGMVLQRNKPIPVWGHADAGEDITVTLNKKKVQTTAGSDGRWRVDLPQMKAGGPYELTVNDVTISNVLIGDASTLGTPRTSTATRIRRYASSAYRTRPTHTACAMT